MLGDWGKYRLDSFLARGGMAEVYKATALGAGEFKRAVCIKRVCEEFSDDPTFIEMFEREARIAAGLQHPNIVQVTDFDRYEGRLFLVMDYVHGMDLQSITAEASRLGLSLPLGFALRVLSDLLEALGYAHSHTVDGALHPVIHRDVSPGNILVSTDGHAQLTDFGIAKDLAGADATQVGVLKGKPSYMSPEQAAGTTVGPASDLFSAGVVFWEMLSGRRLFKKGTFDETHAMAIRCEVPALEAFSAGIGELLGGLLAKDPSARFPSASEALEALRAIGHEPHTRLEVAKLVTGLMDLKEQKGHTAVLGSTPSGTPQPSARAPSPVETPPEMPAVEYHGASVMTRSSQVDVPIADSVSAVAPPAEKPRRGAGLLLPGVLVLMLGLAGGFGLSLLDKDKGRTAPEPAADTARAEVLQVMPAASPAIPEQGEVPADVSSPVVRLEEEPAPEEAPPAQEESEDDTGSDERERDNKAERGGFLQVNCRPWAKISVDGKSFGTTPLKRQKLPSGRHRVRLTNEALGYDDTFPVRIRPGQTTTLNKEISSEE